MNDDMRMPRWLVRRGATRPQEQDQHPPGLRDVTILDDLNGLKIKLEMTVQRMEAMIEDEPSQDES